MGLRKRYAGHGQNGLAGGGRNTSNSGRPYRKQHASELLGSASERESQSVHSARPYKKQHTSERESRSVHVLTSSRDMESKHLSVFVGIATRASTV